MLTIALFVVALVLVLAIVQQVSRAQRAEVPILVRVDERRRRQRR